MEGAMRDTCISAASLIPHPFLPPGPSSPPPLSPPGEEGLWQLEAILGVVLCEVAVTMLALGSNTQRYALIMVERSRNCCGVPLSKSLWVLGLVVYFGGNVVYTMALAFAPASLCAALIATVVVANALISRIMLGERKLRADYHGSALIIGGIALTAAFAPFPSPPVEYDAPMLAELFVAPSSILYLLFLLFLIVAMATLVLYHESSGKLIHVPFTNELATLPSLPHS